MYSPKDNYKTITYTKPIKTILSVLLTVVLAFSCAELEEPQNGNNNGSNNGSNNESNDSITLEFTEKVVSASEQTISVGIASSGDWIVTEETSVSWCSVTKETSTTAVIAISENKEYDSRTAVYVFKCGNATAKLILTQSPPSALIVTTSEYEIEAEGGEISIPFSTNLDYKVEFEGDASSWIKVKELRTKSLEDCTLVLEIAENVGDEQRIGVLNLIGENIKVPITITQRGNYVIYYTTTDNQLLIPNDPSAFGSTIESNVYENGIGKITFSDPVTSIGDRAFYGCSSLTSIEIPNSVTSIGNSAFSGCSSLTSVEIPNSVTSIGDYAFSGCSSLTSVEIPNSVTSIGNRAFQYCSSLTSIEIPNSVTSIGISAFNGCSSLTSIEIPNSVTSIGISAFNGCSSLTSIVIGNSVTSIGDRAFYGCSSLTSIEIPNSVTSIGNSAFYYCKSLTSIVIPNSVTSIGYSAFGGCLSLSSVYCKPTTPPTLGSGAFDSNSSSLNIYVPTASVDAYKVATNWSRYASKIVGYNF